MFYYKTETENGTQWESRSRKIAELPDNMTEITETEYNAAIEELQKQWEKEREEAASNKPDTVSGDELLEMIKEVL